MGDCEIELNFFDKLRKGVNTIESSAREFKFQAEKEFNKHLGLTDAERLKIKSFDQQIRKLYAEVSAEYGAVTAHTSPLDAIEKQIIGLDQLIEEFIAQNGLKKMGYKPWVDPNPLPAFEDLEVADRMELDGDMRHAPSPAPTVTITKSPRSVVKARFQNKFGRTPQPSDYGINHNNHKRFTMLPKSMLKQREQRAAVEAEQEAARKKEEPTAAAVPVPKPTYNPFNGECTTVFLPSMATARYELPSNDYRLKSNLFDTADTPPKDNTYSQDQITVEFTPGLTTRRPANVRRVKPREPMAMPSLQESEQKAAAIERQESANGFDAISETTRSLKEINIENYEKHVAVTPRQPFVAKKSADSAKLIRSIRKEFGDTPQMPQPSVDLHLHQRFLARK